MLVSERRIRIAQAISALGSLSTAELAEMLDVSVETIRRDLLVLERHGTLTRVHGGATRELGARVDEAPFAVRSSAELEAKQKIAQAAVQLVQPGQLIVIDLGTTAVQVAAALPKDLSATVATCSVLVAAQLAQKPQVEVLVSGGRMRHGDLALAGAEAVEFFAGLNPDIAFLGSGGLHPDSGLTDFHRDEVATRQVILHTAAARYVLADSTKFGRVAKYHVTDFEQIDGVITDAAPPDDLRRAIEAGGAEVIGPHAAPLT